MSRLINVEAITDREIIDYLGIRYASCLDDVRDMLNDQPTIEAVPVVHAEWTRKRTVLHDGELYCTRCKCDSPKDEHWDFCPNCGADMRKGGTP